MIIIAVLQNKYNERMSDDVAEAILEREIAVYKTKAELTGCSVSWGERRDHYEYRDVLDHYECVFSVKYKDGRKERHQMHEGRCFIQHSD